MLAKEVSRALDVIAKLQFVMAELQRATKSELKRQRKQTPPDGAR
jgi:hypothetical protein